MTTDELTKEVERLKKEVETLSNLAITVNPSPELTTNFNTFITKYPRQFYAYQQIPQTNDVPIGSIWMSWENTTIASRIWVWNGTQWLQIK